MSEMNWDMLLRLFLAFLFSYFITGQYLEWTKSRKRKSLIWLMFDVTVWAYNVIAIGVFFAMREIAER